jgi:hypothetical protein
MPYSINLRQFAKRAQITFEVVAKGNMYVCYNMFTKASGRFTVNHLDLLFQYKLT